MPNAGGQNLANGSGGPASGFNPGPYSGPSLASNFGSSPSPAMNGGAQLGSFAPDGTYVPPNQNPTQPPQQNQQPSSLQKALQGLALFSSMRNAADPSASQPSDSSHGGVQTQGNQQTAIGGLSNAAMLAMMMGGG